MHNRPTCTHATPRSPDQARAGIALFVVLAALCALSLLAATLAMVNVADVQMLNRTLGTVTSLYEANAGTQYILTRVENDLRHGTLALTGRVETVNYAPPSGLAIAPVTRLEQTCDTNAYCVHVTGYNRDSTCRLEIIFRRLSLLEMGIFGNEAVAMKQDGAIYAFDSRNVPSPTPTNSNGQALVGSNESVVTHQNSRIDGSFLLGVSPAGQDATWTETPAGGSLIDGMAGLPVDRVDPDPMGVVSGSLAQAFAAIATTNNNATAVPPITSPHYALQVNNGDTVTLSSGSYYVGNVSLKQGATLNIQAHTGPVTLYLTGSFIANEGATININGTSPDFIIYSNSDDPITLRHNGDFRGVIYAPLADVEIKNSADFEGLAWGAFVDVKNGGAVYIDQAAMDLFLSSDVAMVSWKECRL